MRIRHGKDGDRNARALHELAELLAAQHVAIIEGCSEKTRCGLALYVPSDHLAQWDEFAPVARKADAQGKVVEREMRVAILLVAPRAVMLWKQRIAPPTAIGGAANGV